MDHTRVAAISYRDPYRLQPIGVQATLIAQGIAFSCVDARWRQTGQVRGLQGRVSSVTTPAPVIREWIVARQCTAARRPSMTVASSP